MTKAKHSQRCMGPWHKYWHAVDREGGDFPPPKIMWVNFVPLKVYENENNTSISFSWIVGWEGVVINLNEKLTFNIKLIHKYEDD